MNYSETLINGYHFKFGILLVIFSCNTCTIIACNVVTLHQNLRTKSGNAVHVQLGKLPGIA